MKKAMIFILLINYISTSSNWRLVEEFDNTPTNKYSDVQSINCLDSVNCCALIQHSAIEDYGWRLYKSTDTGKSWHLIVPIQIESPKVYNVSESIFPQSGYFFISSSDDPIIAKSNDSGKTFKKINLQPEANGTDKKLRAFAMYDRNYGFITNGWHYFTTTDGWETFERHGKLNNSQTYYSPVFLDSNTVGMIYGSPWAYDMGLALSFVKYYLNEDKWDTLSYFQNEHDKWLDAPESLYFVNDSLGYATGWRGALPSTGGVYDDVIYKTTDGGFNWELILKERLKPEKGFYDISFADEKNGVAVGYWGKIAMTNDGGESWVYEPTPNAMDNCRKMLVCWAGQTPLIGTWDGGIFRYEGDFFDFPIGVEDREITNYELRIRPNPAGEYIEIKGINRRLKSSVDKIEIYSALGIIVLESEFSEKIDISHLPAGVYFLKIGGGIFKFAKY